MKVFLYQKSQKMIKKSGIGRAFRQQSVALKMNGVEVVSSAKDDYDIAHFNTVFPDAYKALKKIKKQGKPVVVHAHSTKEDYLNSFNFANLTKGWFYRRLKKMYSAADVLITPSEYSKGLIEGYAWTNKPIYAISNGIVVEDYAKDEAKEEAFLKHFNLTKDDKVIIGIGLLFVRKGVPDFIEVARSFPDVKFIWFGSLSKAMQTRVIKKAIKNKPDNVIMPGYIAGDIIKGALTRANGMLFPSYEETEGIVVLEGMASRIPVLVRDIPVYDPFTHNFDCLKASNNEEFVIQVRRMLEEDLSSIVEEGYKNVCTKQLKHIGEQMKNVYETLIEKEETK